MLRIMKTPLSALAMLVVAALPASWAPTAVAQEASETRPPDEVIKTAVSRVRDLIKENADTYREDSDAFYAMIDEEIVPYFDMPYIARLVLARHARSADKEQRRRFTEAFKNTLMRTYADAMLEYNEAVEAEFLPLRMEEGAEQVTVDTRLVVEDGENVPVGFVMHKVDSEWLIYDINVEGISLVTNFRAQFNQRIRENGLDALIERLEGGEISTETPGA
ncbi:MlaC/ttg2D family ABC transporter substrate-binding protein [Algiphilus aromaticivorans]|uniref:MlaC/ttg2D family ABC transporter substrate-binding protein n=1 Tax=Algiphilus aromaticivorans TaxID=382454 RepID=UPI0009FEE878|nr:ABC transporter substrate-binding protein [Algiphilus aromaticivorans]